MICHLASLLNAQECHTLSVEECADYWYCQLDNDICTGYEPLIESSNLDQRADNRWSLTINSTNTEVEANEGNNIFHLGMCSECSDGYNVWEESESMNPFTSTYIDLYFLHLDYQPIVGYSDFNTDYRSIHSSDQLVVWNIAAFINGVDEIQLEWSFDNFIPQEYKIYLVDGSVRYNMRNSTSVLLQKEAFYPNGNETNIKLEIGICADTGTTTHYLDSDGDGWGSDISGEFCDGYAPANWVTNQDDVDNDCNCEENNL